MKKKLTVIFTLILASQLFINCSDDDDASGSAPTAEITGTWDLISSDVDGTYTATIGGLPITADITGEAYDIDLKVTISEDPNTISSVGDYSLELTMTLNGISETENQEHINAFETADWTLDGDELTIIVGTQSIVYNIVELTSTTLVLKTTLEELLEEDGATISIVLNETLEFSR